MQSIETCPCLPGLQTLSLNLNAIVDIDELVDDVSDRFDNLVYISLLGNPCCPAELTGGNDAVSELGACPLPLLESCRRSHATVYGCDKKIHRWRVRACVCARRCV
jgi:hypothetical protein